jgi:hypothetical protein
MRNNISQISALAAPTNKAKNPSTSKSPLGPEAINEHLDHVFDPLQDDSFLWMMINSVERGYFALWKNPPRASGNARGWRLARGKRLEMCGRGLASKLHFSTASSPFAIPTTWLIRLLAASHITNCRIV